MLSHSFIVQMVQTNGDLLWSCESFSSQLNFSSGFDDTWDMLVAIIKLAYILFLRCMLPYDNMSRRHTVSYIRTFLVIFCATGSLISFL